MEQNDYFEINKQLWNERTGIHFTSEFYGVSDFLKGKSSLRNIELDLIGDVTGKSLLHLQCHFGMDTLSFARMGAAVTGIDLSNEAISKANELKQLTNLKAEFICCNLYDTLQHVNKKFDIVFTSYGTIGWLPDLDKWAEIIVHCLQPGGIFLLVEFHPLVWMFDNDIKQITYSYFNKKEIIEEEIGTYTDRNADIKNNKSISWNHSLDESISSLLNAGLQIESFKEYDYSPYNIYTNGVEIDKDKFQIQGLEGKLPLVFSVKAKKVY
ncbi:MAG: class I SAM-dependent methyltransferase [Chitinophagales bacterium]|nr:class I SAM-dependent methyltransferase [Chitinophagales bacterium]